MTLQKRTRAPGAGRKPAGDYGERVSRYPPLLMRLPIGTQAPMRALAEIRGIPLWRLFNQAAWELLKQIRGVEAEEVNERARQEAAKLKEKRSNIRP